MVQRMVLEVPGTPSSYAKTLINEALGIIYDSQMWSWQLKESGWLTPGLLFPTGPGNSAGTVTFIPYSNQVVGDAVATAAWLAYTNAGSMPLFTQLQIRSPFYSLYNIVGFVIPNGSGGYNTGGYNIGPYGGGGGGSGVLTLDRPWMEPGGAGQGYMIYQAYFSVPVPDFKRFLSARDTTNNAPMDFWSKSQKDLSFEDPERTVFDDPAYIVPYETDQRQLSSTAGNMLYELWPQPLSVLPYSFSYLRRGPLLVNGGDTVPYPLTEEAVLWRAKEAAFLFKEAQKGEEMQRGSGADWRFLAEAAEAQYKIAIKPIKDRDRDLAELYFNRYRPDQNNAGEPFATINGGLNVGRM
jgi:hypothetical protein